MRKATAARLAPLADSAVLTRPALKAADVNPDLAGRLVRRGEWRRLAVGLYLPHGGPASEEELVAAARAHVGDDFIVTGALPLRAVGARWVPPSTGIHVLVPDNNQTRTSGRVRVTTASRFTEIDRWVRFGARYAAPARAVVDTARSLRSLRDVRGLVLGAVWDRLTDPAELRSILATGQRNGSALTRRAIGDAERGCASPPEAELVDALIGRRLPFYVNAELWLDGVLLGSADVYAPGLGIGGEVESKERHGDEEQTENTYDRHERITSSGLELVHLSVRRIRTDVQEAAAHFVTRARARVELPLHSREPVGLEIRPRGPLLP